LLQEVHGFVRDDISGVAGKGFPFAHLDEGGIVVNALPRQDGPVIKTLRVALQMPFADHAGVITGALQFPGDIPLTAVELIEDRDAIAVGVFSGENARAAWGADGVDGKTAVEAHAVPGQSVEVRRLVDFAAVGADGVRGVVVGHDEDNVGPRRSCICGDCGWQGPADETPNTKHQTPKNLQGPNTKIHSNRGNAFGVCRLVFRWCLAFGVWCFHYNAQPLRYSFSM